jgi:hypothetical protein
VLAIIHSLAAAKDLARFARQDQKQTIEARARHVWEISLPH